jgi:septal ring factor EnvC (AmiA/AmiB activator)
MTPDEMDKKIEFILEMQAQFSANMGRSEANIERCEVNIDNLTASVARSEVNIANLTASVARSEANLKALIPEFAVALRESAKLSDERFSRSDERMTKLDEKLARLADAQKTTDERLNALISVVERHITGPDHVARP